MLKMNCFALLVGVLVFCVTCSSAQESNCIVDSLQEENENQNREYYSLNEGYCCVNIFDGWFQRNIIGNNWGQPMRKKRQFPNPGDVNITYAATDKWNSICRRWRAAATCMNSLAPDCEIESAYDLLRNRTQFMRYSEYGAHRNGGTAFHDRACDDGKLKDELQLAIDDPDVNTTCLSGLEKQQFQACSRSLQNELRYGELDMYLQYMGLKAYFDRLAESTLRCMRAVILESSCNEKSRTVLMHVARFQLPSIFNISLINIDDAPNYNFTAEKRCTVGVYGDPHIRVCFSEYLQTCKAPGMQNYLSNTVFSIHGENKNVGWNGATSLKSVNIVFKTMDGTQTLGTYTAENFTLPATFGGNVTVLGTGSDEVVIFEANMYRKVILQQGLGLILVIRRWADNYFFTLRMAENAIDESTGLLSSGCPEDQLIRRGRWVGNEGNARRLSKRSAAPNCTAECESISDDQLREACTFDCEMTGDVGFAQAAKDALTDIEHVPTEDEDLREGAVPPATEAPIPDTSSGESSTTAATTPSTRGPRIPWWRRNPFWFLKRIFRKFIRGRRG